MMVGASLRSLWTRARQSRRVNIIVSAILIGVVFGTIKLGLPLEDLIVNARTSLRHETADDSIVLVAIDNKTLSRIGAEDVPRSLDAKLIEQLASAGVGRIFFDRDYHFRKDPGEDQLLVEALRTNPGKVVMGSIQSNASQVDSELLRLPDGIFRPHVEIVSIMAFVHPFMLSASIPFKSDSAIGEIPSMAAKLADREYLPDGIFRPDYAIDIHTIPRYSYIDIVEGQVPADKLRGRDVVIGGTAIMFKDVLPMPSQGMAAGAYFHIVAAHTLKRGMPIDLGWLPAFGVVALLIVGGIGRGRSVDRYRIAGIAVATLLVPYVCDGYYVKVDVVPALVTAGIAIFRGRALDRVEKASKTNAGSGLPSVQALKMRDGPASGILVALKLRNYGAITGSFAQPIEAKLASEIVRRIHISEPDAVVYHEGDMFLWLSIHTDPQEVSENLHGLHQIVQNGLSIDGRDIDLAFNCGVVSDPDLPISSRVASAMQSAEEAVRTDELVCHYDSGTRESQWEVSLLSSLDRAIDNGEVWVAYQPKLDLRSGQITGGEALVRWTHPERGPIRPDEFIGLAEEFHRIERITRFVLHDAARSTAALLRRGHDFTVSVNISAQLLRSADLSEMIFEAIEAHGVPPERMILEITETDRLDRGWRTLDTMKRLVAAGFQLSIDDFGTGNATIDYLRYLPACEVKIDKAFVQGIEQSREDFVLVQSIIDMAHSLDRRVVAEGVESAEIVQRLREMGCDIVQGYHVSRPVPFAEFGELLGAAPLKEFG